MKSGIDTSRIESMLAHLKAAAANAKGGVNPVQTEKTVEKADFSVALKTMLDQVNGAQHKSKVIGERFALGDDSVNLSEVMIASQKASIAFQATVQVRNKLVSAYQDIMNMQV
ncbi:flagellar hook-basal body complex protein FliE [Noviherbaspirillum cavernae]|uniref:Flagellar hook-basal body complex protein FliE n=1 Tax=Noviherbaspirillum cavernae TaxID=2320862 RepID=A0A418X607_9BURK|nr:flagellar hook-basal body complex protein FliE [Noviherbaspirillum cavernae]RJG07917.1 flagellar hook-basal body complex protein FliE [Noviherbaspirillum cavernae]